MPYQYKREPLTQDEATRLANACTSHEERLAVWTLLDTGLRVAELANLTRTHLDWQGPTVAAPSAECCPSRRAYSRSSRGTSRHETLGLESACRGSAPQGIAVVWRI